MLSAAPATAMISPAWFQSVNSGDANAGSGSALSTTATAPVAPEQSWIVQFQFDSVKAMTSVAETSSLVAGAPGGMDVVKGLGQVGQVLVKTQGNEAEVAKWFAGNSAIATFEKEAGGGHVSSLPNDPYLSYQHNLDNRGQNSGKVDADIDASEAWNITTGSRSVVVAVVDTGIDYTHPDLVDNIWTNPGEIAGDGIDNDGNGFIDDIHGWDFANDDNDPMDDMGHGTHVAGIIGATGNNGVGVVGVNWQVSLMAVKMITASNEGTTSGIVAGLNYVAMMRDRGVNVRATNNSWNWYDSPELKAAVELHDERQILFVAAAANDANDNDTRPDFPSSYPYDNIISVGASDNRDRLTYYSNYGKTSVDLVAPGGAGTDPFNGRDILSTVPPSVSFGFEYGRNGWAGTSMASPHVAGVAALGWALKPDASMQFIREAILGGIDTLSQLTNLTVTGGRLNAYNTLRYLQNFDLRIASASVAGSKLTVVYEVTGGRAPSFDLGFYRSIDTQFGGDTLLSTQTISATADRTPGIHTKVFTIGMKPGQVPLPALSASYSLLAVVDPADRVTERGGDSNDPNNVAVITGARSAGIHSATVSGTGGKWISEFVWGSVVPAFGASESAFATSNVTGGTFVEPFLTLKSRSLRRP